MWYQNGGRILDKGKGDHHTTIFKRSQECPTLDSNGLHENDIMIHSCGQSGRYFFQHDVFTLDYSA
jgi:hypothetical protein